VRCALRSGKGKAIGALHDVLPADLLCTVLRELVQRTGVDPVQIDDVLAGAVTQVGDQAVNIAVMRFAGRGFSGLGSGCTRPPVRQQPAGDQFRRLRVSLRAHTTWSSLPVWNP